MTATTPARPNTAAAPTVIGWDIGGAHVKASLLVAGRIADIVQWPTPMWQGLEHLDKAVAATRKRWLQFGAARHAVTMTAEMADLFPNREAGVLAIANRVGEHRQRSPLLRQRAGWAKLDAVAEHWETIASATGATARMIALSHRTPCWSISAAPPTSSPSSPASPPRRCAAMPRVWQRRARHLGVVRTPLCARRSASFGTYINVMNEFFATPTSSASPAADLDHDQYPPADGATVTAATCQRLARMIGRDARTRPRPTGANSPGTGDGR